jgi:Holliday junction resolvase RusA-like endonuclease
VESQTFLVRGKIPTANHAYRVMKGHTVKTDLARRYISLVVAEYRSQGGKPLPAKTPWAIEAWFDILGRRDLDNCLKVFMDGVKVAVGVDDRYCMGINARKVPHDDPQGRLDRAQFSLYTDPHFPWSLP